MRIKNPVVLKVLLWITRIWTVPPILFALGEVLAPHGGDEGNGASQTVQEPLIAWVTLGFRFLGVGGLALGWWKEGIGGGLAVGSMLVAMVLFGILRGEFNPGLEALFLIFVMAPGLLFLWCWLIKANLTNTDIVLNLCSTIVPEIDPHRTVPTELAGIAVEELGQTYVLSTEKRR